MILKVEFLIVCDNIYYVKKAFSFYNIIIKAYLKELIGIIVPISLEHFLLLLLLFRDRNNLQDSSCLQGFLCFLQVNKMHFLTCGWNASLQEANTFWTYQGRKVTSTTWSLLQHKVMSCLAICFTEFPFIALSILWFFLFHHLVN